MSTLPTWVKDYAHAHEQRVSTQPWVNELRQEALERFASEGWPSRKIEAWRHTSMLPMEQRSFEAAFEDFDRNAVKARVDQLKKIDPQGFWAVFINGQLDDQLSHLQGFNPRGTCVNVSELLSSDDAQAKERIQEKWGQASDGFTTQALNLAFATQGMYVHVPEGVELQETLHIVHVHAQADGASFSRSIFDVEDNAHLKVVEHHVSTVEESGLNNTMSRAWVGAHGNFFHLRLQQENTQTVHLSGLQAFQDKDSHLETHSLSLGAGLGRSEIETNFDGENGYALLNGLYFVDGRRHIDHNTVMNHNVPHCLSHEYFRGIMDERGRGVFTGRIRVAEGADGTDAIQRSDSLLLAKMARADTRPELEIFADDVKCAHGATVGKIDEDSLFYLRARGLSAEQSRDLLIYAFATEVIDRIKPDHLRKAVTSGVQQLLPGGLEIAQEQL
ncbi:MAG TPA: Fe-S cluster assembly protein SufD [Paenalcaligenes sp.]|nr:Fe-S cluster assembly protein SufD [Paenalcaligenes sp.]